MKAEFHKDSIINQTAMETIISLSMGNTVEDMLAILDTYEEAEMYEYCSGIMIGIDNFSRKLFNCKVGNIRFE